ncbi:Ras-related protein Rab [Acrasis kona]|uniref:Ras-related protein Rab n=1 Tax=Acrasis kona TaxID=1008807 RepID=A0AAW2ZHZ8_9EUKA
MRNAWDYDYLCKIVVVGDSGAGKSCLLRRHIDEEFQSETLSTIAIDFKLKTLVLEEKVIKVQFWEGQERFQVIDTGYYRRANGILVVYDVTNEKSFQNIPRWLKQIHDYSTDDVKLILVGTKIDDIHRRVVSQEDGQRLAKQYEIPFIETSAKNNINVDEAFNNIIHSAAKTENINKKPQTPMPIAKEKDSTWFSSTCSIM